MSVSTYINADEAQNDEDESAVRDELYFDHSSLKGIKLSKN